LADIPELLESLGQIAEGLAAVYTDVVPIPTAARVTPSNCSDVEIAPALMKESCELHRKILG